MDTEKISRLDYKTSKGCNCLLEGDNTVGPRDSNLFLLCKTFSFLSESDFYSLTSLLALFSKQVNTFNCFELVLSYMLYQKFKDKTNKDKANSLLHTCT